MNTRRNGSPPPIIRNSLQKLPTPSTPRHQSPTMSPSPSQDSHYRAISPSRRHASPTRHSANGAIVPALLMPPPTTWLGSFRLGWYRLTHRISAPTPPSFRFALFLLKMTFLVRACWPNNFNIAAGSGLVLAAAVDLSWTLELWMTGLLLLLHFVLVSLFRWRAHFCQAGPEMWDWNPAFHLDGGGHA